MNAATQRQALIAGGRTAIQTFQASLLVILGAGGLLSGLADIQSVQWVALGGALAAGLFTALFAGLNSYLNFTLNGVPAAYKPPVPPTPAVVAVVAPVADVPADPAPGD